MRNRGLRNRGNAPAMFESVFDMLAKLGRLDSDRDGVPDHRDCRPFNPKKHRIRPSKTMRKRLEQLPVYVTKYDPDSSMGLLSVPVHIMDPSAKALAPEARTLALSVIKKYPSLVGKMEKRDPTKFTFVGAESKLGRRGQTVTWMDSATGPVRQVTVFKPTYIDEPREPYLEQRLKEIKQESDPREFEYRKKRLFEEAKRVIFKDDPEIEKHRITREGMASTGFHELEHVKQAKDVIGYQKRIELEQPVPYSHRQTEREAREAARQEILRYAKENDLSPEELEELVDYVMGE